MNHRGSSRTRAATRAHRIAERRPSGCNGEAARPAPPPTLSAPRVRFDLQRFAQERTLPATARRRRRARSEGRFPRSADFGAGLSLLGMAGAVAAAGPAAARGYLAFATGILGAPPAGDLSAGGAVALLLAAGRAAMPVVLPIAAAGLIGGVLAEVAQSGAVFTFRPLQPDFARCNPLQGLARLFSARSLVDLGRAALKAGGVVALAFGPVRHLVLVLLTGRLSLPAQLALSASCAVSLAVRAALVHLAVAMADAAYRRWEHDRSIRMSREELREEVRETDGDPTMRARRRRRMREMARRRSLANVPRADVVLANPTHVAVALRYDPARMAAPVVLAKGADLMAERVKVLARAAGVPIVENPPLARALFTGVRVGQYIPSALYQAVAEVLAFVWRVRGRERPAVPAARAGGDVPWL